MKNPLLARETDYAVRALCFIAARPGRSRFTVDALARALNMPRPFLRHILQVLNREKILRSFRGRLGGFELAVAPETISLARLALVFQGPLEITGCLFRKKICPDVRRCFLRREIVALEKIVSGRLQALTIASLLRETGPATKGKP